MGDKDKNEGKNPDCLDALKPGEYVNQCIVQNEEAEAAIQNLQNCRPLTQAQQDTLLKEMQLTDMPGGGTARVGRFIVGQGEVILVIEHQGEWSAFDVGLFGHYVHHLDQLGPGDRIDQHNCPMVKGMPPTNVNRNV